MGRICAIVGCGNSNYRLTRWKKSFCESHQCNYGSAGCTCPHPFTLHPFPIHRRDPQMRAKWIQAVNRKNEKTGKNWAPSDDDRICSSHFVDGHPSEECPCPVSNLDYVTPEPKMRRPPPKDRPTQYTPVNVRDIIPPCIPVQCSELRGLKLCVNNVEPIVKADHSYTFTCNCQENCRCIGCLEKQKVVMQLRSQLEEAKEEQSKKKSEDKTKSLRITSKLLSTDVKVSQNTGFPSRQSFFDLFQYLELKVPKLKYWSGVKKVVSTKAPRAFAATPKKSGPTRKLSALDEMTLVMMKLRMDLSNAFLADLYNISSGTCSAIINTWVKFLAIELKPLIYWPTRKDVRQSLPSSLAEKYPTLTCTIDCSEVFIERPRNLKLQAYKKSNTVKFLIAIAPNGMISFLSECWGGRASDQHITRESGFLGKIRYGDVILADRGFPIQSDLLFRGGTLEIPPPGHGLEQMTRKNVLKTKRMLEYIWSAPSTGLRGLVSFAHLTCASH